MTMNAEAIKLIQDSAVKAAGPHTVCVRGQRRGAFLQQADGSLMMVDEDPVLRGHELETIDSLISFVSAVLDGAHGENLSPVVWVSKQTITVCVDDRRLSGVARMSMSLSEPFGWCLGAAKLTRYLQRDFLLLLRTTLAGCLGENGPRLISMVRTLKFTTDAKSETNLQHGRESMGAAITSLVCGISEDIQELALQVRVFNNHDIQDVVTIRCILDIDLQAKTFRIVPLPFDCQDGLELVVNRLYERIKMTAQCPVYRGDLGAYRQDEIITAQTES